MERQQQISRERAKAVQLTTKAYEHREEAQKLFEESRKVLDALFPVPRISGCCDKPHYECSSYEAKWVFEKGSTTGLQGKVELLEVVCRHPHSTYVRFHRDNQRIWGTLAGQGIPEGSTWTRTRTGGMLFKLSDTRWIRTSKVDIFP